MKKETIEKMRNQEITNDLMSEAMKREKDIKTFLGDWQMLDNNKMKRVVDPIRLRWFYNQIKLAENRGYQKCLKKRI